MSLLSGEALDGALRNLPEWRTDGHSLVRRFAFPSFSGAIGFVNRLADYAEQVDHHPDLLVTYRHVTVTWSTHSAGGITMKDVDGARAADAEAAR